MNMMLHQQNNEKFAKEDCVQQKLMSEIRCLKKREVLLTYYKVNIQKSKNQLSNITLGFSNDAIIIYVSGFFYLLLVLEYNLLIFFNTFLLLLSLIFY